MYPVRHDINDGRSGNTWRYSFDFGDLGKPGQGYLANLSAASFRVLTECGQEAALWDLDSGLSVADAVRDEQTYPDALLKIEPPNPLALPAGQYQYAIRLEWASGVILDLIEGYWAIAKSRFEIEP